MTTFMLLLLNVSIRFITAVRTSLETDDQDVGMRKEKQKT